MTAIQVCAADGEYHAHEKAKIRQMVSILGIEEEIVEQLEQLQKKESLLRHKLINLLYPLKSLY